MCTYNQIARRKQVIYKQIAEVDLIHEDVRSGSQLIDACYVYISNDCKLASTPEFQTDAYGSHRPEQGGDQKVQMAVRGAVGGGVHGDRAGRGSDRSGRGVEAPN